MAAQKALTPAGFAILLALGGKLRLDYNVVRHGYGIARRVEEDSLGRLKLGPGVLYGTLKQLSADGLIEVVPIDNKTRRISYRLTRPGWNKLEDELKYYQHIVFIGHARGLL